MTIYFYKVWQPYGCFSNFSPHGIHIQGTYWSTVEHYYQAQKFVGSVDEVIIPLIHAAATPEEAAALGRCSTRKCRRDWDLVKTQVMREAVLKKFLTHAEIREVLLTTEDEILVENSPTDYFWGCGASKTGDNHLGKILMSVREEIRKLKFLSVISE
ncbi:NADAR family protein [Komarekiella sp. 'clone 1']|uniref:Riboflavin biosynthesis intermediates N-glycosidase n=1 Tax=Komarekiella delphini-convector SJRDD-AB1 TaxID=2593771 RepID=A0AA40T0E4_9NOST|nr:NADAR domain-containing protein [Komarekiella delphini-convector]MBD6618384.1 NADAR family protein [Komarekiella delphini-convector SJRDD-AB1]